MTSLLLPLWIAKKVESSAISTVAISKPNPPGTRTVSEPKQERQFTISWERPSDTDQVDGYDWRVVQGSVDLKSGSTTSPSVTVGSTGGSLTPGTTYSFHVKAKTVYDGKTAYSQEVSSSVTLKPAAPSSLREGSTGKSTDTLYVEWDAPVGVADSYRVEWKLEGSISVLGEQTEDSGTISTISGLLAGRTYTVTVYAQSNGVEGDGHSADFTTLPSDEVALSVIKPDIRVDSIKVTWNEPTNSVISLYRLWISPDDGNEDLPIDILETSDRIFQFNSLKPGREYTLSIALVSMGAEGAQNQLKVTTLPRMVENLAGQTQSTDTIRLTWSIPADSLQDLFEIENTNGPTINVEYQSSTTSYQKDISSLSAGETYTFTVRSKSGNEYSAPQSVTQTTLPQNVATITATTQSPHSVQVTWIPDTNSIQDSYLISYRGEYVETSWSTEVSETETTHLFENLHPGEKYTFKVKPVSSGKIGAENTNTAVTIPYNPHGLKVSTGGILPRSLTIEWHYDSTLSYNTGWRVTYTPDGAGVIVAAENMPVSTLSTKINNLIPGQHYTIMVQGRTVDDIINTTGTEISATTKPVLVSYIQTADTTTTTMTVIYNEDASGNVFDDYIFTLGAADAENMTKEKTKEDMNREVLFDSLVPGTVYTMTAFVQSGSEKSDAQITKNMTVPSTPTVMCQQLRNDYITVRISHQTGLVDMYMVNCEQCAVASQTSEADGDPVDITFSGLDAFVDHTFIGIAERNEGGFNKQSSTGQVTCKTGERVPSAVENFIHNAETIKPYEVTLTWNDPSVSTGVLTAFLLEWSGTKANRPTHELQTKTLLASEHTTTVGDLRPGYNYTFTIYAAVSQGHGASRSINVLMPILVSDESLRPDVSVTPTKGPQAGGTNITLSGLIDIKAVFLSSSQIDKKCSILTRESSAVVAQSPSHNKSESLQIHIQLFDGSWIKGPMFQYKANPTIRDIKPQVTLVGGRTRLTVFGKSLDSVQSPKIKYGVDNCTMSTTTDIIIKVCQVDTADQMICLTLDLRQCKAHANSKQHGTGIQKRDIRTSDHQTENSELQFYLEIKGFILDGDESYTDLSSTDISHLGRLRVYDQPVIYPRKEVIKYKKGMVLELKGQDLTRGNSKDDYMVHVGTGNCLVTIVTDSSLQCEPPNQVPEKSKNSTSKFHSIIVSLGNYIYEYGELQYPDPLLLPLAVGVPLFVLVVIAITTAALLIHRRNKHDKNRRPQQQQQQHNNDLIVLPPIQSEWNDMEPQYEDGNIGGYTPRDAVVSSGSQSPRVHMEQTDDYLQPQKLANFSHRIGVKLPYTNDGKSSRSQQEILTQMRQSMYPPEE